MSSKKYKNLYVNGCSFTAGHEIKEGLTWPELLSKKLNLNLINSAVNGNSMESIVFSSVCHLEEFNSDDTLVIIGLTWETRIMLQFDKFLSTITTTDIQNKNGLVKLSTWRRALSPYTFKKTDINKFRNNIDENAYLEVYSSFVDYYRTLVKNDKDIQKNQFKKLEVQILLLQSFLKDNNYDYRFISWAPTIHNNPKFENVITFDNDWRNKFVDKTSHPTILGCHNISEVIYDSINK